MKNIVQIIVEVIVIVVMRNGTMSMISPQMPVEEMEAMVEMEGMEGLKGGTEDTGGRVET